jgi:hypothetical protein
MSRPFIYKIKASRYRDTYAPLSAFERTNFAGAFRKLQLIAAITKYQVFLASAIGLPKDDTGRIELMAASLTVLEKIRQSART